MKKITKQNFSIPLIDTTVPDKKGVILVYFCIKWPKLDPSYTKRPKFDPLYKKWLKFDPLYKNAKYLPAIQKIYPPPLQ